MPEAALEPQAFHDDDGETLTLLTPAWAEPLLKPCQNKGAKGGRSGGKSHFFAEMLVENIVADPNYQFVCIREIQKSLKYSAKKLVESKIRKLGYAHLFKITDTEIRRLGGEGLIIFQGMQDHTADSIKSLEGFDGAWCIGALLGGRIDDARRGSAVKEPRGGAR